MKKKKVVNLSEEPSKKPILSKQFLCPKRRLLLTIKANSLIQQRIKRTNAIEWSISPTEVTIGQKRVPKALGQMIGLDKCIRKMCIGLPIHFTDQDVLYLIRGLKRLKCLQRVDLLILYNFHVTDTGLSDLVKGLKRSCWLKSILFNFGTSGHITNVGLHSLGRGLKKMTLLNRIYLQMWPSAEVTNKGREKLFGSLNRLARLKRLSVLAKGEMTDMSLMSLRLQELVSLREIHLEFEGCEKLTDEGLYFLAQGLKRLLNLQKMKLRIWDFPGFSDMGLHYIWEMIESLFCLQSISLVFSEDSWLSKAESNRMNGTLKDFVCFLKENRFGVYSCFGISDFGFASLCQFLERSVSLQSLHIEFDNGTRIADDGVISLCKALERLVLLKGLNFSFKGCDQITDFAAEELINRMEHLTDLQDVEIEFGENVKITEKSVNSIIQFLKSRASLKETSLCVKAVFGTKEFENLQNKYQMLKFSLMVER